MPMSASCSLPHRRAPRQQQMARLQAEERDGARGLHDRARCRAGGAVEAARHIDGDDRLGRGVDARPPPRRPRHRAVAIRPAPNSASTMRSAPARSLRRQRLDPARPSAWPCAAASPRERRGSPSRPRRTLKPRSRKSLRRNEAVAAVVAGSADHGHTRRRLPTIAAAASATARPAFSISARPGTPVPDGQRDRRGPSRRW